jgi:hypothetical protein
MAEQGYEGRAQWDPAFYVYAGVLAVGACCWLAVDARQKIDGPSPGPGDASLTGGEMEAEL